MDDQQLKTLRLLEILKPFRQHWGIVLIAFLCVFLTVVYFTFSTEPIYEATATFFMIKSGDIQNQIFDIPSVVMQKYVIKNQVAILKSRNLAVDVVKRLQQSPYKDSLAILGQHSSFRKTSILQKVFPFISKKKSQAIRLNFLDIVDQVQKSINVLYGEDTDIVEFKGRAGTPWEAALIVNTWVDTYQDIDRIDSRGEVLQANAFFERKLTDIKNKLNISEEALTKYQNRNQVVSLTKETEQLVEQLSTFETLFNQTKIDLEATDKQLAFLTGQLDESKKTFVKDMTIMASPMLQELQKQMAQLVTEKAAYEAQLLGAGYKLDGDLKLKQMENRLTGVKDKISEETQKLVKNNLSGLNPLDRSQQLLTDIFNLKTNHEALNAKEKSLKEVIDRYNQKLIGLPQKNIELIRLERDVQVNSKIYEMVKEKYEEMKIRDAGQAGIIRIVDRATPPSSPILPKTKMNLVIGCIFGIFFGCGLAFARNFFEDSIRSTDDLHRLQLDVIAGVPSKSNSKTHFLRKKMDWTFYRAKRIYPYFLMHRNGNVEISETFRTASTKIYLSNKQHPVKTILFTSPNPSEGKSTTVANMAVAMANRGLKTLLVDSDLRGPVLDILFTGSQRNVGLTNYLGNKMDWTQAVRETAIKGLYLMPAGNMVKNAPEILGSTLMRRFIEQAKKEFGIILFDSPPILPVADALILASLVDGVVLVMKSAKTSKSHVQKALDILKSVDVQIIGGILNGIRQHELVGYRDYYKSYFDNVDSRRKKP